LALPFQAGEAAAGRAPLPCGSPRGTAQPAPAAAASPSAPRPISSLWPTRRPSPRSLSPPGAGPCWRRGAGGGGRREGDAVVGNRRGHPLPAVQTCPAGLLGAPDSGVSFARETLLLSLAPQRARETKLTTLRPLEYADREESALSQHRPEFLPPAGPELQTAPPHPHPASAAQADNYPSRITLPSLGWEF
jgi:hypothetical protein